MKELVLFVDEQNIGPFPIEDVKARFDAGEFPPETPCIEPDGTEWSTLSEVFPAERKTSVRIARKTKEEEAEMKAATSEKLDPDVRKKLMLYNLADAITVDKFTPVQADAAIQVYEKNLNKEKKLKIAAGVGGFIASCALASLVFNCVNFSSAPGGKGRKLFETIFAEEPNPELAKTLKRVGNEVEQLEKVRAEAAAVKFLPPRGNGDPRQAFLGMVEIKNPDVSTVTGTFDFSELKEKTRVDFLSAEAPEAVQLSRLDGTTEDLIRKQNELFAFCSQPMWTERDLREAIVKELAPEFPMDAAVPESKDFANRLKAFRRDGIENQLAGFVKRAGDLARSKDVAEKLQKTIVEILSQSPVLPKEEDSRKNKRRSQDRSEQDQAQSASGKSKENAISRTSTWAKNELAPFLEKFAKFLQNNAVYWNPKAREQLWGNFVKEDLPQIQESVEKYEKERVPIAPDGTFVIPGRNTRNIIAVANHSAAGTLYYIPKTDETALEPGWAKIPDLKANRKILTPEDVLMDERYKIVSKEKVGGMPVVTSGKILAHEIFIVRTTPEWHYITVERINEEGTESRRQKTILLGVPADFYASVEVDDEVPMEKLLTFERFSRTAESPMTGRLIPINEDKLEEVKTQQASAGITFPPPPESPSLPEPENAEDPVPSEDSAEPESTDEESDE